MSPFSDTLLRSILSQPTAPFREGHVISLITAELNKSAIPHFLDPIGNIVIGASSAAEYQRIARQKTEEPLRIFIAHMDHPGFHGVEWKSTQELKIKWHGGSPTQHLEGARVWLANPKGWAGEINPGIKAEASLFSMIPKPGGAHTSIRDVRLHASGRAIDTATAFISDKAQAQALKEDSPATTLFGGFQFRSSVWQENEIIYTKAADDLIGCFSVLSVAKELWKKKKSSRGTSHPKSPPFLGLLTRAEEVGFIGAIGHFELGWLKNPRRPILCISLETSRTLPGAEIGKGPVVRLGDRFTVFNPEALRVFSEIAAKILPERHQRRIMDGGTCEATAATIYGFTSIGISVPLGNYHNQSFEGGPDSVAPNGPAPEFVHTQDISGLISLCHGLLKPKLPWHAPWDSKLKEFRRNLRTYRPLLRSDRSGKKE